MPCEVFAIHCILVTFVRRVIMSTTDAFLTALSAMAKNFDDELKTDAAVAANDGTQTAKVFIRPAS